MAFQLIGRPYRIAERRSSPELAFPVLAEVVYSIVPESDGGLPIKWADPPAGYYFVERLYDGSLLLSTPNQNRTVGITDARGCLHLHGAGRLPKGFHVHHSSDGTIRVVPRRAAMMAPDVALVRRYDGQRMLTEQVSAADIMKSEAKS